IIVEGKDTPEIEAMPQRLELHASLRAAAADRRGSRVAACEVSGRNGGRRTRALDGDLDRIDQRQQNAAGIEQQDRAPDRRQTAPPVVGKVGIGLDRHIVTKARADRKSTRLNSSHLVISYAVF